MIIAPCALLTPPEPPPRVAPFGARGSFLRPLGLLRGVFLRPGLQPPHGPLQGREQEPPVLTVRLPLRRELLPQHGDKLVFRVLVGVAGRFAGRWSVGVQQHVDGSGLPLRLKGSALYAGADGVLGYAESVGGLGDGESFVGRHRSAFYSPFRPRAPQRRFGVEARRRGLEVQLEGSGRPLPSSLTPMFYVEVHVVGERRKLAGGVLVREACYTTR